MGINADTTLEPPLDAAAADVLERVQDRNSKNRKNDRNLKVVVVAVVGVRNTNTCIQIHKQEKCAFRYPPLLMLLHLGWFSIFYQYPKRGVDRNTRPGLMKMTMMMWCLLWLGYMQFRRAPSQW